MHSCCCFGEGARRTTCSVETHIRKGNKYIMHGRTGGYCVLSTTALIWASHIQVGTMWKGGVSSTISLPDATKQE